MPYVSEAKRQIFGDCGIDMLAGPSEILIIADRHNRADWIASDLLSQAEHDNQAQAILICDDAPLAKKTIAQVNALLKDLPRKNIAKASWEDYGAVIIVKHIDEAAHLANQIAAEHVELLVEKPEDYAKNIRHAGSIFLGPYTPEVLGDYVIGVNHILPTSGSARFSSGLSVYDFLKRTSITQCSPKAYHALAKSAETLAHAENLTAHAKAAAIRLTSFNFHNPDIIKEKSQDDIEVKTANVNRISDIHFGEGLKAPKREELEYERKAALHDLIEENSFSPFHQKQHQSGPHVLTLSCEEGRLIFSIASASSQKKSQFRLALKPLSRHVRDYFLTCESYYDAIQSSPLERVEEIDHNRRQIHDEGGQMLKASLAKENAIGLYIDCDLNTARRLFTLICVMYMK